MKLKLRKSEDWVSAKIENSGFAFGGGSSPFGGFGHEADIGWIGGFGGDNTGVFRGRPGTWQSRTTTRVSTSRVDNLLSTEIIPFQRPIQINFEGQKFRPWGKVDVYYAGELVNDSVTPSGGIQGGAVIAGPDGKISGTFFVPPNRFRTGENVFALSDDPTPVEAISYGATLFRSGGTIETRQATNTTTTVRTTESWFVPAPVRELNAGGDGGGDPLAQTFFVNTKTTSPGCFITKIDLFFKDKDPIQPVEVELRNVVNGYPGGTVIAKKIIDAADVVVSANSTRPTTFVFDRPAYVTNNRQYSFVIKTNSTRYNAWVAELGGNRVDKNESVAKQPNAGVMFISANDTTWSPVQTADVKFKVYVAKFSTSPATVITSPAYPNLRTAFDAAVETFSGTAEIRVFAIAHSLEVGSTTTVDIELPSGITTINGIVLSAINGLRTITKRDSISFSFNASAGVASSSGLFTTAKVTFEPNAQVDSLMVSQDITEFPGTFVSTEFKGISGKSVDGSQQPFVVDANWMQVDNHRVNSLPAPKIIPSFSENAARFSGIAHTQVKTVLSTIDPYVSPFIRLQNSGLVSFTHFMNNPSSLNLGSDYVDELSVNVGSAHCRYITKPVGIINPAKSIKVRFAANCVQGNFIDVYYRTVGVGENAEIASKTWTVLPILSTFINTPDEQTLFDYNYEVSNLAEFKQYQIKIVIRGENSAQAPYIKDLRILSLAT